MGNLTLKPIAVLGAGSWGTALALNLARRGQTVRIWSFDAREMTALLADRSNKQFLPGFEFPETLLPVADLAEAIAGIDEILIAVPSVGYRNTLNLLKPLIPANMRILSVTKGLDAVTGELLHEVAFSILGKNHPYAVLSGPSFAREVAEGLPTSVSIASENAEFRQDLMKRFDSPLFRTYPNDDVVGTEIGGVAKNVIAIATGISDGMAVGTNARSALITRGLAEIIALGKSLGGKTDTFLGLAGLGDLILTCSDDLSRNRRYGLAIGKGKNAAEAEKEIGQVVEGKNSADLIANLAAKHNVAMPICNTICQILHGTVNPQAAFMTLITGV
jgi:glycerol-3-phosphate dehydrogenase (NAD(P)+)